MAPPVGYLAKLLDNPNFVKWFGKSAVRDADGLPLEVYHATDAPSFGKLLPAKSPSKMGWVSETPVFPNEIAKDMMRTGEGARLLPGFLDIKNPFDVGNLAGQYSKRDWKDMLDGAGLDGSRIRFGSGLPNDKWYEFFDLFGHVNNNVRGGNILSEIKRLGYDGIRSIPEGGGGHSWAFFAPTQFKSRFNRGTFSPDDPNFLRTFAPVAGGGLLASLMSPDDAEAGAIKIKPSRLTFQEAEQHGMDQIREFLSTLGDIPAVPAKVSKEGVTLLDGHHRTRFAQETGVDKIPVNTIPEKLHARAAKAGYDDLEIAAATHGWNNDWDSYSMLDNQFPGSRIGQRADEILDNIFPGRKAKLALAGGGLLASMMTPQESQAADMGISPGALARMQRGQYNDTAQAQALDSEPIVDPVGMFVNAATGGGGYLARGIQAATDPLVNWMFK